MRRPGEGKFHFMRFKYVFQQILLFGMLCWRETLRKSGEYIRNADGYPNGCGIHKWSCHLSAAVDVTRLLSYKFYVESAALWRKYCFSTLTVLRILLVQPQWVVKQLNDSPEEKGGNSLNTDPFSVPQRNYIAALKNDSNLAPMDMVSTSVSSEVNKR